MLGCSITGLIYVFWQNGFATTSVKALVMAYGVLVELVRHEHEWLNLNLGWHTAGDSF